MARILIIEDNKENLQLMTYLCKAFGHDVTQATDGEDGLAKAHSGAFDLVVCDIHLPKLDGYGIISPLKGKPESNQLPVVAVSALAMVGDREKILAAGFDGYFSKPINPEVFVQELEAFLPGNKRVGKSIQDAQSPLSQVPDKPVVADTQRGTILLVDDRPENIGVFRSLLHPSGFRVLHASNSADALFILEQETPDLIISDLHIHNEPNFHFLKLAKDKETSRDVPFIQISATTEKDTFRQKALELGADLFLFLPMEPEQLLREILSVMDAPPPAG